MDNRLDSCSVSYFLSVRAWAGKASQGGQAALEALVCLLALAVLWGAAAWIGRIQDLSLQTSHAARHAAFQATRKPAGFVPQYQKEFFSGEINQWRDLQGRSFLGHAYQYPEISLQRAGPVSDSAQPGGTHADARRLREGWQLADTGVLSAIVSLSPGVRSKRKDTASGLLGLGDLEAMYPAIVRHTAILTDAGHVGGDAQAVKRIVNSDLGWSGATDVSYRLGRSVASVAGAVDGAWNRPLPVFDWLGPWADRVPQRHVRP